MLRHLVIILTCSLLGAYLPARAGAVAEVIADPAVVPGSTTGRGPVKHTAGQTSGAVDPDAVLWYGQPAEEWTDALPLGNGHLGAMVFGGPEREHLQLNEVTLYSGDPDRTYTSIDIRRNYPEVMALLKERRYAEAQQLIREEWLGRNHQCYQPMGDLWLEFSHTGEVRNYQRRLDLERAVATVRYEAGQTLYEREYFISNPDRVMVIRLRAEGEGKLNFRLHLSTPHEPTAHYSVQDNTLSLDARAPGFVLRREFEQVENLNDNRKYPEIYTKDGLLKPNASRVLYGGDADGLGMAFNIRVQGRHQGGSMRFSGDEVTVKDAEEVVLVLSAATSYNGYDKSPALEGLDPDSIAGSQLEAAGDKTYDALYNSHLNDYQSLFGRVSLELGEKTSQSQLPTDRRIALFNNGKDPSLAVLYFQFGRYLMISGSRPGGQPLNLQGIWNDQIIPPWNGAYTMNINAEMNYWPAELTNLSECHEPFFKAIGELAINGAKTAWSMYGNEGWVAHHNMDIWRHAEPIDNCICSFWPMAAGWLTSHLWERYLFHGDRDFLEKEVYPLLRGAVQFYKDWLVPTGQGYLVTPVGHSPEHDFRYGDGQSASLSPGPTMDMAIIRESYSRYIEICEALSIPEDPLLDTIRRQLSLLQPYQIGKYGQLQEWLYDFEDGDPHHRHISHLYGMYPGNQITVEANPELSAGVEKVLERRGDGGTGWSKGWKINLWARLHDGDHALRELENLLTLIEGKNRNGTYPNLFCGSPFQIDGNFGGTAGIAEMLVQSYAGEIHLLPALPKAWSKGKVKGLRTRGGFEVDMEWEDGKITSAVVKSSLGGNCRVRSSQPLRPEDIAFSPATGGNPNPLFRFIDPGAPLTDNKPAGNGTAGGSELQEDNHSLIDFSTAKGGVYELRPE